MSALVDIDAACGRYLTFRDLIECGETWHRLNREALDGKREPVPNRPKELDTYKALRLLCEEILDPAFDEFGRGTLSYGFASDELTQAIGRGIAPRLDQHAGSERAPRGGLICVRLGAAVDVSVHGVCSLRLAQWLVLNTPFDRLYYYGQSRPIHVSWGPDPTGQIVELRSSKHRRVPRVVSRGAFLALRARD